LQSLIQVPYTTIAEKHPNTHKGHKTQQPSYFFPYPSSSFHPPF
jgi:hypothetical protein